MFKERKNDVFIYLTSVIPNLYVSSGQTQTMFLKQDNHWFLQYWDILATFGHNVLSFRIV